MGDRQAELLEAHEQCQTIDSRIAALTELTTYLTTLGPRIAEELSGLQVQADSVAACVQRLTAEESDNQPEEEAEGLPQPSVPGGVGPPVQSLRSTLRPRCHHRKYYVVLEAALEQNTGIYVRYSQYADATRDPEKYWSGRSSIPWAAGVSSQSFDNENQAVHHWKNGTSSDTVWWCY